MPKLELNFKHLSQGLRLSVLPKFRTYVNLVSVNIGEALRILNTTHRCFYIAEYLN